ncbi:MAG: hypothetical protein KGK07_16125, partial [Chloroflexota bacterium]|nr:hypothetical protein [Chloroflexota bacterium]
MSDDHTFAQFEQIVQRFGGRLWKGVHRADSGRACVLEAAHAAVGHAWSDDPGGMWPDLRPLNDGPWASAEQRTTHLTRVMRAYWNWQDWSDARQQTVAARLALLTVQRLVSSLPGISDP